MAIDATSVGDVVLQNQTFLEGPRWHEGRIWVSDFYTNRVLSALPDGSDLRVEAEVPGQPSGLGWLPDGRLIVVQMRGHRLLRREHDGRMVQHADVCAYDMGTLNDLVVDGAGRAYFGSYIFDNYGQMQTAPVIGVDADGQIVAVTEPLYCANGLVIIDNTLIVGEVVGNRMSAFAIREDGSLSERRDWAVFGPLPTLGNLVETEAAATLMPDGMAADSEGAIWVANAKGPNAFRVAPGGKILDEVTTGDDMCFSVALGGEDGRTLFLCTAPNHRESERRRDPKSSLIAVKVDVPAAQHG
jgi:sugar lactone lactonase YvrE